MEEEKKPEELVPEPVADEHEDEFLDDRREVLEAEEAERRQAEEAAAQQQAEAEAQKPAEDGQIDGIDMHLPAEEAPATPDQQPALEPVGEYEDSRFQTIEDARIGWQKKYKVWSIGKIGISVLAFGLIIAGWLVPKNIWPDNANLSLGISIGVAVFAIALIIVYSFFQKKTGKKMVEDYFNAYYGAVNSYAFQGLQISEIQGDVNCKVAREEFAEMGVYPGLAQIGSRENITFAYEGMDVALADLAAQKDDGKGLRTIFVGKFLRTHNTLEVDENGIVIYFKGGSRALPPEGVKGRNVIENNKRYVIYGASANKGALTPAVRALLKEIRTDDLLVDVCITIKSGKTYWALGYEDTLMVLPSDKRFDPRYIIRYKDQIQQILNLALAMNE